MPSSILAFLPDVDGRGEAPSLGLRARQKIERHRRIEDAARAVFAEKGYVAATTREIAIRAGVSLGTFFTYVEDKRELLMMVFRKDMRLLTERTFEDLPTGAGFFDQLMAVFRVRYQFLSRHPNWSRDAIRESTVDLYRPDVAKSPSDEQAPPQFLLQHKLLTLVKKNQQRGLVRGTIDAETITRLILDVYINESRMWIALPRPQVKSGVQRLGVVLELALAGVHASKSNAKT